MHTPVLLQEVLDWLDPAPGRVIVDGTVNGGGHAEEILKKISPGGIFLGLDWDANILNQTREKFSSYKESKVVLESVNYRDVCQVMSSQGLEGADGFLLDLGFSSNQLEAGRGFSFAKDEPLFMTYAEGETSVAEILRTLTETQLADVIYQLGGERYARRIARGIKNSIKSGEKILSTLELVKIIEKSVPSIYRRARISPATRTFQALRIFANRELENLESVLGDLPKILKAGGRAVIISFHSLEDAMVKKSFREYARLGLGEVLTKKPIVPSQLEIKDNPRSRSAKLRVLKILKNFD